MRTRDGQTPREVLAANLKKLMRKRGLETFPQIIAASGGALTNGTLDRIRRAANGTNVDRLGPLAEVFAIEPWMLLHGDLHVSETGAVTIGAQPRQAQHPPTAPIDLNAPPPQKPRKKSA